MKSVIFTLLFCFIMKLTDCVTQKTHFHGHKIVETTYGPICGRKEYTLFDRVPFYSFKGIPYAQPPVNELRFKVPQPMKPWLKPRDAFVHGNQCFQRYTEFYYENSTQFGSEDCLYLNVYIPAIPLTEPRNILFFIHGGLFMQGSGNDDYFGPDFLIEQDIIVVTINYRLNIFGFLSLDTPEYSGNMGLKDQQSALKWINANAKQFGGDPGRILLIGECAGGASASYHSIVPSSQGLFTSVAILSGTALNNWAVGDSHVNAMYQFAHDNNHTVSNINDLISYLKTVNAEAFADYFNYHQQFLITNITFLPVIEIDAALQPFLQESPYDILYKNGFAPDADIMIGFESAEALLFRSKYINNPAALETVSENFDFSFLNWNDKQKYVASHPNMRAYNAAQQEIRQFYFGNKRHIDFNGFMKLNSDFLINFDVNRMATILAQNSNRNVFFYVFSVDSEFNYFKILANATSQRGAAHADVLCYIFRCKIADELYVNGMNNPVAMNAIKTTTTMLKNMAKSGNPGFDWQPISRHINFLNITNDGVVSGKNPNQSANNFLTKLITHYPFLRNNRSS